MKNLVKIVSLILTFALIGCGDSDSEEGPAQQQQSPQQGQQGMQGQFQQSAPEVDLSDEELDNFIAAISEAQRIQMESQQEMVGIIKEEGLDVQTYNQIAKAQQGGQSAEEAGVSEEDMEKFEEVSTSIEEAQQGVEEEMTTAIEEDAGMEMERFQEINQAIQQDPELQKRVQQKMQEQMQQQAPPQGGQQQGPPSSGN